MFLSLTGVSVILLNPIFTSLFRPATWQRTIKDMVKLHVKRGNDSQFLYQTDLDKMVDEVIEDVTFVYNGRLKIGRICSGTLLL
jgi:hypothetical protein